MSIFNAFGKKAEKLAEEHGVHKILDDLARTGRADLGSAATVYYSADHRLTIVTKKKATTELALLRKHYEDTGEYHAN